MARLRNGSAESELCSEHKIILFCRRRQETGNDAEGRFRLDGSKGKGKDKGRAKLIRMDAPGNVVGANSEK